MNTLALTFLGTASAYPTPSRCVSCTALSHDEGIWLFDCGEGAQVQLMKSPLKPGKISKIFITHLHGDHSFGLPGLLCTVSQNSLRTEPLEIYGPVGLRHFVCTNLALSRADVCFDFIVHELETIPEQQPLDAEEWPLQVPSSVPFHPCEREGRLIRPDDNLIWHLYSDPKLTVKAVWVKHRVPSFTFVVQESPKSGKLDASKLKAMGVPPGPLYAKLKAGQAISLENGQMVSPSEVVGPSIPGRTVVVSGDSCDSSELNKVARGATVLVHEATLENSLWEQCVQNGHSTPEMTATLAKELDVKMLVITHVSQRYKTRAAELKEGDRSVQILLDEALEILPADKVILAEDFAVYTVPQQPPGGSASNMT
ncbi:zinc phosphodiesterase ELAC protein 1 [Aplysia californica]|uniref:Zinc phosphodiesterase ELAC protein 1 n=1 Tax=Aplysia californica TaxID=6500 RepID=A0ABM0K4C1_APLCA|nr:zinc phosphodiesterase ELAC protein 1 [Aplysia californica]